MERKAASVHSLTSLSWSKAEALSSIEREGIRDNAVLRPQIIISLVFISYFHFISFPKCKAISSGIVKHSPLKCAFFIFISLSWEGQEGAHCRGRRKEAKKELLLPGCFTIC